MCLDEETADSLPSTPPQPYTQTRTHMLSYRMRIFLLTLFHSRNICGTLFQAHTQWQKKDGGLAASCPYVVQVYAHAR